MSGRSTSIASSSNKMSLDGISDQSVSLNHDKSSGGCHYGESTGCASDATVWNGRNKLNRYLRSVLMSPVTFKMFVGFNACYKEAATQSPRQTELLQKMLGTNEEGLDSLDFFKETPEGLFQSAYKTAKNEAQNLMENKITAKMVIKLQDHINGSERKNVVVNDDDDVDVCLTSRGPTNDEGNEIKVLDQGRLEAIERRKKGNDLKLDITVVSRGRLIAFAEVGLIKNAANMGTDYRSIDNLFWKKVDQSIDYIKLFGHGVKSPGNCKKQSEWKATGTILFAVMVFDKENKTVNRMAIFSAEPKDEFWKDFRVSLLWRKPTYKGLDLDSSYGAFVNAVKFLERERQNPSNGNESCKWEYLGPNCSKVTTSDMESYVVRSFENRVRSSSRRPDVYTNYDRLKDDTTVILEVQEGGEGELLPFGEVLDKERQFSTLFSGKRGQIKVVAVPFHEGSHECTSLDQAIQIVQFLSDMHKKNFVHGDIRGYNLVFSDNANVPSTPIDFDFGGLQDEKGSVKYPPGYAQTLADGLRLEAEDGCPIQFSHDVEALKHVLFHLHEFDVVSNRKKDGVDFEMMILAMDAAIKTMENAETMAELLDMMTKFRDLAKIYCKDGIFRIKASKSYSKVLQNNPWTKINSPATVPMIRNNDEETEDPLIVKANETKETPAPPKAAEKKTPFGFQATPCHKKSIGILADAEDKTITTGENMKSMQPKKRNQQTIHPKPKLARTDAKKTKTIMRGG